MVAFISCSKTKKNYACKAKEMYQGALFKKSFKYCSLHYSQIFILSAKYGLLKPDDVIEPYEETLNNKSKQERRLWSEKVKSQMKLSKIKESEVDIYAGSKYSEHLSGNQILKGMSLGFQLQWFNSKLKKRI